ncbi:hypothetical protein ABBQ38_001611 [Trebouxia sp. C0009 RCD-2024]
MSDENASYVGNQAEPRKSYHDAITEPANVKEKGSQSHSSDGGSVDDQFDDASSGDEIDDENAESDLKPYIFSSDGARRSFVVQQITRANSSHRPSFTFVGYVVEYTGGSGNKTERGSSAGSMSSRHHREDSQTARGGLSQRSRIIVIASDLSLNITYEPPSPKFHQQCPGSSSYRLKLFKGSDFLYSVRGLPHQVKVHQNAYVVRWGPLELQFNSKQQLDIFASSIKHVVLEWTSCGQHTARQTAATLQSGRPPASLQGTTRMAPSHATSQAQPEPRSSFGSPLPASDSKEINLSQKTSQSGPVREEQSASLSENVSTSKNNTESGQSFWKDNWVWIGVGVTIVAAVAFSVFKADAVKETVTKQEFKLQMVE